MTTHNLYEIFRLHVLQALHEVVPNLPKEVAGRVELFPTKEIVHGDMATNAALVVAKILKLHPRELAQNLSQNLSRISCIEKAESAGPGFVNLTLSPLVFQKLIPIILESKENYGTSLVGKNKPVNVEYVSANPTGPMHVGHCRGAVVGDVLANLMSKAGYQVTKEYYINDAGAQVVSLTWASYWRYLNALGRKCSVEEFSEKFAKFIPSGLQYQGDYLIPVGAALVKQYGDQLVEDNNAEVKLAWFEKVKTLVLDYMMQFIKNDLEALGVHHDKFVSEQSIVDSGIAEEALKILDENCLLYTGVLQPPKGKTVEDWEERPQTLFKSSAFGDDVDRPLRKSDGSATYFANDLGYHYDKMKRGAKILVDIWGADHGGYIPRMKAAITALDCDHSTTFEVILCQIVKVVRQGKVIKMSKRAGNFVTLRDLIDEVGKDAVRFTMLTRKADAQMNFDLEQVVAQTKDNPIFYVQYAHARCRSVLRAALEQFGEKLLSRPQLINADLTGLVSNEELALMRRLAQWPRTVENAALAREPHRIAYYLIELASDFHILWNAGRDNMTLRFIQEDDKVGTLGRLALIEATATIIRSAMKILGIEAVEEMR